MPHDPLARPLTALIALILGPISGAQEGASGLAGAPRVAADTTRRGPGPRASLWWGDLDHDGREDVYAVLPDGSGRMLMNRGGGRFEDVTALVGLSEVSGARLAAWTDVDGDGREDLFVAARQGARLFVQAAGGALIDESAARGLVLDDQVLEARFRDLDGDGRPELALTTSTEERMYLNDGRGCFVALDLGLPPVAPVAGSPPIVGAPPEDVPEAARERERLSAARAVPAGGVAPGLGASGSQGAAFGSPSQGSFAASCADRLRDQASPGSCLAASTMPTLGELYPISNDLFVEAATGRVGINTISPSARFDVNGGARFNGQARFESQIVSNLSAGAPFLVASVDRVVNLNADMLDGLHASDFATLPVDSGGILDGTIADTDVSPTAAIQGTKLLPNFGDQEVTTTGLLRVGPFPPGGWSNAPELMITGNPDPDSYDSTQVFLANDGNANGQQMELEINVRDEPSMSASIHVPAGTLMISGHQLVADAFYDLELGAEFGFVTLSSEHQLVRVDDDLEVTGAVSGPAGGALTLGGSVELQGSVDLQGSLSSSTGSVVIEDSVVARGGSFGDGTLSGWEVRGLSGLPDSHGYLAVQGTDDFEGLMTLDIPAFEVGVLGVSAGASVFDNIGVLGHSNKVGVRGENSYFPQRDWGELGTAGYGVVGSGGTSGVRGERQSSSSLDWGELGTLNYGVEGSGYSAGVHGLGQSSANGLDGVHGESDVLTGFGVWGLNKMGSGAARGVVGETYSPSGDAVTAYGDFAGTGAKYFVQPHPTDATKEVRMVCLEGNESGTYFRGTTFTLDGRAELEVPEVFRLTTAPEGLTVQVTPVGGPARMWIESKGLERIVVRSDFDVEFDYFVNGVRRGYEDLGDRLVRENRSFLPTELGVPFGTQYPAGVRRLLVENGILNADYTPNETTIAVLEAQLDGYRARRDRLAQQRVLDATGTMAGVEEELHDPGQDD